MAFPIYTCTEPFLKSLPDFFARHGIRLKPRLSPPMAENYDFILRNKFGAVRLVGFLEPETGSWLVLLAQDRINPLFWWPDGKLLAQVRALLLANGVEEIHSTESKQHPQP